MSNNKKQKGNRRLLLIRAVLAAVFIVGAFLISPIVINRAKTLKCPDPDWTGFCEGTTKEESIESKTKGSPIEKFIETTKYQSGKTLWDGLELFGTLAVPILIAFFGLWFQHKENKRAELKKK